MTDEEKLKRLALSRRAHRGQMTKLMQQSNNLLGNLDDKENLELIENLVESMDSKLKLLCDLDYQIQDLTEVEKLESAIVESDDYMEKQKFCIRKFYIASKEVRDKEVATTSVYGVTDDTHAHHAKRTRLPKLSLPRFDGDLLKWTTFIEAFNAAVGSDNNLDDIQKLQYLQSQLDGEAARTIEGLPLSNANYMQALALLEKRYGQRHKLIATYMKAMWELPKPSHKVHDVKDFHDRLETYIRGLKSLGKSEDAYGDLLVPVIFEKLPPKIKTQISRDHGDKAWTLQELREALRDEIEANLAGGEQSEPTTAMFMVGEEKNKTQRYPRHKNHPGKTPHHAPTKTPVKDIHCAFCDGNHYSNECGKVTDQQKRWDFATQNKLCFNCLRKNHTGKECTAKGRCRTCGRKHHTSLCRGSQAPSPQSTTPQTTNTEATHVTLTPTVHTNHTGPVLLKTATTRLWLGESSTTVNILLDEGAQRTFISEKIIHELDHICTRKEDVNLSTFGSAEASARRVNVAEFSLETRSGETVDMSALVVPTIATPVKNHVQQTVREHPYLQNLPLADHVEKDAFDIDLLIGADHYWSIVCDKVIRGPGPTAVASKLGFLLSGPSGLDVSVFNTMICKVLASTNEDEGRLADYWDLETIGIKDETSQECTFEEYSDQLVLKDGRYIATLPWKSDHPPLPTNYYVCLQRTRTLVRRMSPDIRKAYNDIITDQLSRGFIEPVVDDDNAQGHYIPHHPVHKDSSTTPIRIVYDCSCKTADHPSLNDCLHVGPCLTNDLVEILLRFRLHSVGLVSDIEKAFLNIELEDDDRDFTKFLWLSDPDDPNSEFRTYRFKAVLFGSVSSPFILNSVLKTHLEAEPDKVTEDLLENIYVDNLVSGTDNAQGAVEYYKRSVNLMNQGGFNLRSWATNDTTLQNAVLQDGKQETNPVVKVLGIFWNTKEDTLTYKQEESQETGVLTKREVVAEASSLYDPLGFLSPIHIRAKMFIQRLWRAKCQWDDPLSDELEQEWIQIRDDLHSARDFTIKRPYFINNMEESSEYELHVFADASSQAYGAVVYLKHQTECAFVMSKSRVRPLKDITLPRLELLAAFVASRLAQFVTRALHQLKICKMVLWSDSQIVLHWIYSKKKLPTFVENRVKVIRETPFTDVKYCPTADNPADLLTRGVATVKLKNSALWQSGPSWLPESEWPICDLYDNKILACQTEDVGDEDSNTEENPAPNETPPEGIGNVMDIDKYSTLPKLLRITAYMMRFIRAVRKQPSQNMKDFISVTELNNAQDLWIRSIQNSEYSKELQDMRTERRKKNSLVHQLKLFTDENGLIRCGGRLHNANVGYDSKHPILIPRDHYFTRLVVRWAHSLVLHAGSGTTVTFIRNTFWIPRIRQVVKVILRSCVTCRRVQGKPYRMPETPPLPKCRLEEAPPFTVTGVDFTGALYYKTSNSTSNKAYICLFTCAVTRAVHLEIVTDMTTGAFLQAFRRFAARRSLPSHLISDNGTTFLSAVEEIQAVCRTLATKNVQWTFIPKRAPWFGGFYERMVGITKNVLKKTLGHNLVTLDELNTLTAEIEAVINDRPITYSSHNLEEPSPLTPSMLLHGRNINILPHVDVSEEELLDADYKVSETLLQRRSKELDHWFTRLWTRWKGEYLPALRETHMHNARGQKGDTVNVIKTGDVVLMHEDTRKRIQWPLAIVTKLKTGNDGLVRSAEIRTKGGVSNRPICKLYPLEVTSQEPDHARDSDRVESCDSDASLPQNTRPLRQAASRAKAVIKEWTNQLN